jgi:hypothetical protein
MSLDNPRSWHARRPQFRELLAIHKQRILVEKRLKRFVSLTVETIRYSQ